MSSRTHDSETREGYAARHINRAAVEFALFRARRNALTFSDLPPMHPKTARKNSEPVLNDEANKTPNFSEVISIADEKDLMELSEPFNLLATKRLTVMVVDDDPILLKLYTRMLKRSDVEQVQQAENGERCLELLFKKNRFLTDVLLLDDQMPNLRGLEVARKIGIQCEALHQKVPSIYLCTGSSPAALREECPAANKYIRGILQKPLTFESLQRILEYEISGLCGETHNVVRNEPHLRGSVGGRVFELDVSSLLAAQLQVEHMRKDLIVGAETLSVSSILTSRSPLQPRGSNSSAFPERGAAASPKERSNKKKEMSMRAVTIRKFFKDRETILPVSSIAASSDERICNSPSQSEC